MKAADWLFFLSFVPAVTSFIYINKKRTFSYVFLCVAIVMAGGAVFVERLM